MCSLRKKVENFLYKYNLKNSVGPILVGFSGGFDSLCLLNILEELKINVIALHLNHNWRGNESLKDMEFCKRYCENKGIPFYSETLDEKVPHTETAAREARYDFFERAAKKFNSKIVFTAHNAEDNAETVLYRIIKGTGIEGLCAISEHRGYFYRPLLHVSRAEIEQYCLNHNLTPNIDSSNNDIRYKRNLIRHKIIPVLREINKETVSALNTLSEIATEETELLNEYVQNVSTLTGNSTTKFIKLSPAMQNKIIYNLFKANYLEYDREKILNTVKFINDNAKSKSGKTKSITTNLWILASCKEFYLISRNTKPNTEINIKGCGRYEFDGGILTVEQCTEKPKKYPSDDKCIAYIETDKVEFTLRYRKDGDTIHPLGINGSQKLKKYFNSKNIPNHKKDIIPLLCNRDEVLWVIGYGISDLVKVENQPSYVLKFTNKQEVGYGN